MKKYLNKGLIYNWFNSAKIPIIIGLLSWGFIANEIITHELNLVKSQISQSFLNYFSTTDLANYFGLGVIFVAIYFIAQGINKRNTTMFLASGPYTKKQIKYNELMCILVTLVFFVLTYAYIAFMAYIRNRELLTIVEGYGSVILIEIARIVLIGIIGIMFMHTVDLLFSNSVIGFISMIFVMPISIYFIIIKIFNIVEYLGIYSRYILENNINSFNSEFQKYTVKVLIERGTVREIRLRELFFEVVIALIIIVIMFFIFNVAQKRYKLECCNKIFSSKTNENIIVILVSVAIGSLASLFLLSDFINNMQRRNDGDYLPLVGLDLVKGLSADFFCMALVGFITYKIMKKVLKALV